MEKIIKNLMDYLIIKSHKIQIQGRIEMHRFKKKFILFYYE